MSSRLLLSAGFVAIALTQASCKNDMPSNLALNSGSSVMSALVNPNGASGGNQNAGGSGGYYNPNTVDGTDGGMSLGEYDLQQRQRLQEQQQQQQ